LGSPATIASNDAPSAPASAAADPPPGVGSEEENASSNSVTVRFVNMGGPFYVGQVGYAGYVS